MIAPEAVYIMASRPRGALYVGRTKSLLFRVWQHRTGAIRGHTRRYDIKQLAYYEFQDGWEAAWGRERQLKRWKRSWKIELIESRNPGWRDLWFDIRGDFDREIEILDEAKSLDLGDIKNFPRT